MDTTQATRPQADRRPFEGQTVRYFSPSQPPRGALVMHVHQDGQTLDLVVLGDGDPAQPHTRAAWAMGNSITRARLDIPHVSMVKGPGAFSWAYLDEAGVRA